MIICIYTVQCNTCMHWIGEAATRKQVLQVAKNHGWMRQKIDGKPIHVCPSCSKKDLATGTPRGTT